MPGIFTISLDFELHWGVFDKKDRQARKACYQNTLNLIQPLLQQFTKYDVHVTWATVGALYVANKQEWEQYNPEVLPAYAVSEYSAYNWVDHNGINDDVTWAHFAPDEVAAILKYPGQELGTHTFGHYYCMEPQARQGAFASDLDAVINISKKFNTRPVSLVFPRNQFNRDYLKVCLDKGIKTVRSNPESWFWTPVTNDESSLPRKIFRTGDGYITMGKRTSYPLSKITRTDGEPLLLPASRLFRPWQPKYKFANKLKLRRIVNEMEVAAKRNECYHLWWHPENFGFYPEQNMQELEVILKHYKHLHQQYGMQSWNMGEYSEQLNPASQPVHTFVSQESN